MSTIICQTIESFYLDALMQGRNAQRENLLHYVCRRNQYELFIPLVRQGYHLYEQDIEGRTPIHVAIERSHHECLLSFRKLLQHYDTLHESIQKDLCRTFRPYNDNGYTIIHEAVRRNMQDLVKDILNFCLQNNVQIIDMEVLGCGDSLLHIVVKKNLIEMAKIVCNALPDLKFYENYAGIMPMDLCCITKEMREVLTGERT
ncbi:E3 ubiquitin-protein ligase HACE1 [Stomoxys calcitrans]|uniref:Uncharacterized protein n=1 Tax=Stomoxys calcitrans TaxID=35570 RepID=A0A1I8PWG5_STOCA|nr:E3 ubiquitin-protein ligase HACE1 [Stomoxys calcitrans]